MNVERVGSSGEIFKFELPVVVAGLLIGVWRSLSSDDSLIESSAVEFDVPGITLSRSAFLPSEPVVAVRLQRSQDHVVRFGFAAAYTSPLTLS